ncbi:hypothetical protein WOLCODRAFT_135777 [Wolfiporia cocos MD-104 SS10]|uniref:WD40 repeat-like protein n=1 Tax=Wolfiporia cocos (strain MD-104) TaxID=742152 RepID=A0A2H3J634_WOLCO|nr:hypothetical protein WOLCODRAFT_135777 [Wolfiporia cocos MD-104 SS10]
MLVYDTTRPSAPVKTFTLSTQRGGWGEIVSVSSSPFSKTLVAVASSGGNICLVDLEKEKGLCRTLTLHVPLTSLVFSAEGGTLYAGTENGKVLVQDLRTLDKGPRSITVSERGDRVTSLAIQGKLKSEQSAPKATASTVTTASQPLVPQDVNQDLARATGLTGATKPLFADKPVTQSKPNPVSPTSARASSTTPADTMAGVSGSPRLARTRTRAAAPGSPIVSKKAFSPPRSPATRTRKASDLSDGLDISVRVEDLLAVPPAKRVKENLHPTATVLAPSAAKSEADPLSAASRASHTRDGSRVRARTAAAARPTTSVNSRMRSISGSSAGTSASARTGQSRGASTEHKSASRVTSPVRAVHALRSRVSRTPSPNLPSVADAPVTPPPNATRKGKEKERMSGMNVLGLGTPELERWIRAGEGNVHTNDDGVHDRAGGKRVGFTSQAEPHANPHDPDRLSAGAAPSLAVQLSPRRRLPSLSAASAWAAVPSPLRNLSSTQVGTGTSPAADLLQGILRDAMHDFRQETRQEIVGLHLDMLRMGRGIKNELRAVMDEFRGEMDKLREENCKLRAENERLRRGY